MSVPGAFFEVTGRESELDQIMEGIAKNDGRLTADSSASLDLWMEMKEEWFRIHDQQVIDMRMSLLGTVLDGATNEPAPEVRVTTAGEFAAKWNTGTREDRERITKMLMRAVDDAQRCFIEDHDQLKDALAAAAQRIVELETRPKPPAEWLVLYWHDDCAKCEDHAESAVTYAQVTGSTGATHQETEVVPYDRAGDPSFRPGIAHGAKVKRAV